MTKKLGIAAAWAAVALVFSSPVRSQQSAFCAHITRENLVPCIVQTSPRVRLERQSVDALEGRRASATVLFSANPVLSLQGGRHSVDGDTGYNWFASLSQEFEIAGQRGSSRAAVDAQLEAQRSRVKISERDVAVAAWSVYFAAIAAREESTLITKLGTTASQVAAAARARAVQGLIAPIDADLAEATATRLNVAAIESERSVASAQAELIWLVGGEPSRDVLTVDGALDPLSLPNPPRDSRRADSVERPEIKAAEAEHRALQMKTEALQRSRVPNPTVSLFAQNDPFEGRVVGLGLAFPIPIPGWGRTYGGEIAETEALTQRASTETEITKRALQLGLVKARQVFESRQKAVAAYSSEQDVRAQESLRSLAEEVKAGRLAVRDAIIAEQALVDLLLGRVEARKALCLASVELLHFEGFPLERGLP